jgi:hypothetical protein
MPTDLRHFKQREADRQRDRQHGVIVSQRQLSDDLVKLIAIAERATYEAAIAVWEYRAWKTLAYDLIEVATAMKAGNLSATQIREAVVTMQRMVDAELKQRTADALARHPSAQP